MGRGKTEARRRRRRGGVAEKKIIGFLMSEEKHPGDMHHTIKMSSLFFAGRLFNECH